MYILHELDNGVSVVQLDEAGSMRVVQVHG